MGNFDKGVQCFETRIVRMRKNQGRKKRFKIG